MPFIVNIYFSLFQVQKFARSCQVPQVVAVAIGSQGPGVVAVQGVQAPVAVICMVSYDRIINMHYTKF